MVQPLPVTVPLRRIYGTAPLTGLAHQGRCLERPLCRLADFGVRERALLSVTAYRRSGPGIRQNQPEHQTGGSVESMVFRRVGVSRHERRVWLKSMRRIVVAAADKPATAFEVAIDGLEGINPERKRWLLLPSPPFGQDVRQAPRRSPGGRQSLVHRRSCAFQAGAVSLASWRPPLPSRCRCGPERNDFRRPSYRLACLQETASCSSA